MTIIDDYQEIQNLCEEYYCNHINRNDYLIKRSELLINIAEQLNGDDKTEMSASTSFVEKIKSIFQKSEEEII